MTIYIEDKQQRIVLDTAKAKIQYEENSIDLTGRHLSMFDMSWVVDDGLLGSEDDAIPCKVVTFRDEFTGMQFSIPIVLESAEKLGGLLIGEKPNGQVSLLKRLMKG